MDWNEIIESIITFIVGGGLTGLGLWGFNRRMKKGELEKLEVNVRQLQESEFRDRTAALIKDLAAANDTIQKISGELQSMIAKQVESDMKIARLEAENKALRETRCLKYLSCLDFMKE